MVRAEARAAGSGRAECSRWDRYLQANKTAGEGNGKRDGREACNQCIYSETLRRGRVVTDTYKRGKPAIEMRFGVGCTQAKARYGGEWICWVFLVVTEG